jgi:hypothetical protein
VDALLHGLKHFTRLVPQRRDRLKIVTLGSYRSAYREALVKFRTDAAANTASPIFCGEAANIRFYFTCASTLRGAVRDFNSSSNKVEIFNTLTLTPKQNNMAVARPIRVLGLIAIGLWVFFLYQVFGPEKIPKGPGDTLENMERDPNLDCMPRLSSSHQLESWLMNCNSNWRTGRCTVAGRPRLWAGS